MSWRMEYHMAIRGGGEALHVDEERGLWCLTETGRRSTHQTYGVIGEAYTRVEFSSEEEAAAFVVSERARAIVEAENNVLATVASHFDMHRERALCALCKAEDARRAAARSAPGAGE